MLVEQVYVFLWSIITGAFLGLLFDLFRAFRYKGIKDIWVYIQDIIFWLVTAIIIIISAFIINDGELRGYMLIGYILGAGFYMLLFSKFILNSLRFIFDNIHKAIEFCMQKLKKIFNFTQKKKKMEIKQEIWNFCWKYNKRYFLNKR